MEPCYARRARHKAPLAARAAVTHRPFCPAGVRARRGMTAEPAIHSHLMPASVNASAPQGAAPLSPELRARLTQHRATAGTASAAAAALGINASVLTRGLAGLPIRAGSVALISKGLADIDAAAQTQEEKNS